MSSSLRSLGHPLTLACIGLLLVNDHILKGLYPSALTGKLSDFAGLFFFPYLLTTFFCLAGLAISLAGKHLSGLAWPCKFTLGQVALSAYVSTGVLFSAFKVSPAFNAAANGLLSHVSGLPIWILLDPTDLIALLALAPSFALLASAESTRPRPAIHRSLAVLGLASLAVLATSPCPPAQPITHLVPTEKGLYALATAWEPVSNAFISTNEGQSWEYQDPETLPAGALRSAAAPVQLPKTVCVPALDLVCYRIAGEEKLEASADGGQTWQVAWSVPASRRAYMARVASGYGRLLACGKDLDLRASDIVVLERGEDHIAVVALGNEGILRGRYGLAEWSRLGVGWAEPSPENGEIDDLFPPMIIQGETIIAIVAGMAAFIFLSMVAWARLEPGGEQTSEERKGRSPWIVGTVVDLCLLVLMALANLEELIRFVAPPLFILTMVVVSMVAGWSRAYRRASLASEARHSLWISSYGAILVGALAWIPFALWVLGTIPGYSAALLLAVIGVLLVTTHAIGRLSKPSRPASQAG